MIPLYYSPDVSSVSKFEHTLKDWLKYPYVIAIESIMSCWFLLSFILQVDSDTKIYCSPLTDLNPFVKHFWKNNIVYVDVHQNSIYMDVDKLNEVIDKTSKLNIIFIQHWNGYPCNIDLYKKFKSESTIIIEDASSIMGIENLYTDLHIQVIELSHKNLLQSTVGGLIILPTKELYTKCLNILDTVFPTLLMNDVIAYNGLQNMEYISHRIEISRQFAEMYNTVLTRYEFLESFSPFDDKLVYPTFAIRITNPLATAEQFVNYLLESKIQASTLNVYSNDCKRASDMYSSVVLIPCGFWLDNISFDKIIRTIDAWYKIHFKKYIPRLVESGDYHKGLFQLLELIEHVDVTKLTMSIFKNMLEISSNKFIYVIEMDSKIVAHAILNIDNNQWFKPKAYIDNLIISPEYRGKYLGKTLINHMIRNSIYNHNCPSSNIYILNSHYPNEFLHACDFHLTTVNVWNYNH